MHYVLMLLTERFFAGFMYYPPSWNEKEQTFPDLGPRQGDHGLEYPLPEVYCDGSQGLKCSNAIFKVESFLLKNGWI